MASKPDKRLTELRTKAAAAGQWPLVATVVEALAEGLTLDRQVNIVGALHEVGCLRNRLAPLWKEWRNDPAAWIDACLKRIASSDYDYWALAALLGTDIRELHSRLLSDGFTVRSIRSSDVFDKPAVHTAVYAPTTEEIPGDTSVSWAPALEIGWDSKSGEVVDAARWRAVLMNEVKKVGPSIAGKGHGSHYLRAGLPYGAWRMSHSDFAIEPESIVAIGKTLLK